MPRHATRPTGPPGLEYSTTHFCNAIENDFVLTKIMAKLHEIGIGIACTTRARKGWLPKELSNIKQKDANCG
eukprot:9873898-Ditylum_brightwellii.AAC.1